MATGKEEESRKKKPTITLPPRPSMESLYGVTGFSPGPMTLVSSFFSEDLNYQSFSQLLAGAMASPLARQTPTPTPSLLVDNGRNEDVKHGDERGSFSFKDSRPRSLVVATNSPFFSVPPGLSPSGLLNSPGFFPPQSPFGMSHQQALAQVTAQAVLAQSNMHLQAEYQPAQVSASAESLAHHPLLTLDEASQKPMQPANSDPQSSVMDTSEVSQSDGRHLNPSLAVDKPADDGYNWRKYGQKPIKGSEFPRSYYKCTHLNCPVKKKVERSSEGAITQIIYKNEHNHEKPQLNRRAKDGCDVNEKINSQAKPEVVLQGQIAPSHSVPGNNQESSHAAPIQIPESSDSEELGDADNRKEGDDDEPNPKRRNIAGEPDVMVSHKTVTEPKIIVQTRSEVDLLDDGYRWRKYGQKVVKGNPYPRSYYKCTSAGCNVRKHVERAPTDPKAVITTYEGKHNHDVPASRNSSQNAANNAPQLKRPKAVTQKHPLLKDMEFGNHDQRPVLLRLKEEQIIV
ncbi:probable WRKY transcription factor 3 [Mangifera indica]|uniref:probable WRKY transcription factor 3 n=1 Tax=Mangifera indica TaxID=29780 RepID=UPI001CFB1B6F|nr:probable WRKY transcription factor 3 [Mangifera indica]